MRNLLGIVPRHLAAMADLFIVRKSLLFQLNNRVIAYRKFA